MTPAEINNSQIPFEAFGDSSRLPLNSAVITESLNNLWEQALDQNRGGSSYSRITLADLVILADSSTLQRAELLMLQFAQERPSRCVLIYVDDALPENSEMFAEIGIACNLSGEGGGMLCWERICVHTPGSRLPATPNAVRTLTSGVNLLVIVDLLPKLIDASVNSQLYDLADYVFFDSAINRGRLSAKIQNQRGGLSRLFDLNYERDHHLRETIKSAFDSEESLSKLDSLSEIVITLHGNGVDSQVCALYLCGWLSAKLKLELTNQESQSEFTFRAQNENHVSIKLTETTESVSARQGQTVKFLFGPSGESLIVYSTKHSVGESEEGEVYRYQWSGGSACKMREEILSESYYILRRISDTQRRGDYAEALRRTLSFINSGESESTVSIRRYKNKDLLNQSGADLFVEIMRQSVRERGRFTVALAGGSTPIELYKRLADSVYADCDEWSDTYFFFGDERSVPPTDKDSNYLMSKKSLLDHIQTRPDHVLRMKGELDDLAEAAREYQEVILRTVLAKSPSGYPAFDLVLLGLGPDGHTASIFEDYPDSEIGDDTLVADLYVKSQQTQRLTLTPQLINAAGTILFLVSGTGKANALKELIVEATAPAARIKPESGQLVYMVDEPAASGLKLSDLPFAPEIW